jgi:hypothetical protein
MGKIVLVKGDSTDGMVLSSATLPAGANPQSMIRKSGYRFSEKIMLKQKDKSANLSLS